MCLPSLISPRVRQFGAGLALWCSLLGFGLDLGLAQVPLEPVKLILMDGELQEGWPDGGMVAVRRTGTAGALAVNFTFTGTALLGTDYLVTPSGTSITIPDGEREVWLDFTPVSDVLKEAKESIVMTLTPGAGYAVPTLIADKVATLTLANAAGLPGVKEACRFLTQSAFGPDADSSADSDIVPQNVATVMRLGFSNWIDDQFKKPVGRHQPYLVYLVR